MTIKELINEDISDNQKNVVPKPEGFKTALEIAVECKTSVEVVEKKLAELEKNGEIESRSYAKEVSRTGQLKFEKVFKKTESTKKTEEKRQ